MKKYCLSACFKDKLSRGKENLIHVLSILLVAFTLTAVLLTILYLIGTIIQIIALFGFDTYWFHRPTLLIGLQLGIVLPLVVFLVVMLFLDFVYPIGKTILSSLYYVIRNLLLNIIAPSQADCRIFEECKE